MPQTSPNFMERFFYFNSTIVLFIDFLVRLQQRLLAIKACLFFRGRFQRPQLFLRKIRRYVITVANRNCREV